MGSDKTSWSGTASAPDCRVSGYLRGQLGGPGRWRTGHRSNLYLHPGRHAAGNQCRFSDGNRDPPQDHIHHDRISEHAPANLYRWARLAQGRGTIILGYSIGKWVDETGTGQYNLLEVETRNMKGPRSFDPSGIPLHSDNQTIVKERNYLDRANPDILHD